MVDLDIQVEPMAGNLRSLLAELAIPKDLSPPIPSSMIPGGHYWIAPAFTTAKAVVDASGWQPARGRQPGSQDWLHLASHYSHDRDVFITSDKGILELRESELPRHGVHICAMRLAEYLARRLGT